MKPPTFDSLTLRALSVELGAELLGGQIQKIRQPDEWTVLLHIHRYPKTHRLLFCIHPEQFRAHLTTREYPNSPAAPEFCMALRKYLEGARVQAVKQDGADRVLRLVCSSSWGTLQLVAELMGRHSNLVLLNEHATILDALKPVGSKASHRVVLPGRPYPPLPPSEKPSLWDAPLAELETVWLDASVSLTAKWLVGAFGGMSPFMAETVLAAPTPQNALNEVVLAARAGNFQPTIYLNDEGGPVGAWPLPAAVWPPSEQQPALSLSIALDEVYANRTTASKRDHLLRDINTVLNKEEKSIERRRADLRAVEDGAARAENWRIAGELLTANAHAIEKGQTRVALPNYYDADLTPMEIALDAMLSPRENADAYFARQRKARAAAERLPAQRAELDARAAALAQKRATVETADEAALTALLKEWGGGASAPAAKGKKQEAEFPPGVRIRRYTSEEGWSIWVGENATGNDYLTTRASDADDIWLHVRAAASAHGIIKTGKKPETVPPATLRRAAEIVASKSEAKGSGVIPVDYTLRRYVRKPRNAAPGRVTYEREKTLFVEGKG